MAQDITGANREFSLLQRATHRYPALSNVQYRLKKQLAHGHARSYRVAMSRFISAERGEAATVPDLQNGYRSFEVICAAEESAQTAIR